MARLQTSFILGYHGCQAEVGEAVLSGAAKLIGSNEDFHWLGPGVYFWESDPLRAWEWADWKTSGGDIQEPFVIGAAIDLGNCLDLLARDSLELVQQAYSSFVATVTAMDERAALPHNKRAGSKDEDNLLRFLDCAVIKHLHSAIEVQGEEPFDTVRGLFTEGEELFPGSGFQKKTHIQIAVRNPDCIKGLFRAARP
ncbi:MAG: hypothetical protein AB7S99_08805 [Pseudodonghicola sp.]